MKHVKLLLFQKCICFLSFQGEESFLSAKKQLLEKVKKWLPGMFDVLDVDEASPGLTVNEHSHWYNCLN